MSEDREYAHIGSKTECWYCPKWSNMGKTGKCKFCGTQNDSPKDFKFRQYGQRPKEPGTRKLTEAQVRKIREIHAQGGISARKIAKQFEVSNVIISKIIKGELWKQVK